MRSGPRRRPTCSTPCGRFTRRSCLQELSIECNQFASAAETPHVPRALMASGTPFSVYAAASGSVTEVRLRNDGAESALAAVETMLDYVCSAEMPALMRYLSALRISMLAVAHRVGGAEAGLAPRRASGGCARLSGPRGSELEGDGGPVVRAASPADRGRAIRDGPWPRR